MLNFNFHEEKNLKWISLDYTKLLDYRWWGYLHENRSPYHVYITIAIHTVNSRNNSEDLIGYPKIETDNWPDVFSHITECLEKVTEIYESPEIKRIIIALKK